jgi:hypothetical protein
MRLIVNSSKLIFDDNNKIRFYLPFTVQVNEFHLINCSIPYSFYNINSNNNKVQFNGSLVEIPPKQYNALQLSIALKTLINNLNVVFDRQSLKYTFSSVNPFTFNTLNIGYILGLENQHTYSSTLEYGTSFLKSINACDMTNRIHNIYIKSNIAPPKIFENEVEGNGILYRIPILTTFGSMIYYQNNSNTLDAELNQSLRFLEFQLTDTYSVPLDFNGLTYQLEFYIRTTDDDEFVRTNNRILMGGGSI